MREGGGTLLESPECRFADSDGWDTGEMATTGKPMKTASRTRNAWSADGERQLGQLGTTLAPPQPGNRIVYSSK